MIGFYNASVILTYLGVVSAVFGMSQAFDGNFKIAILCLMISGLTDMYDGTIAKMIKRSEDAKKFGIEIDSLCDLVCFGVYPVVIGYCLGMDQWYARIIYMCYVLGGVIRLAYFNVTEEQRQAHSSSRRKHYQGLPITSVALIIPIVYQFRRFFPEEFPYIYVAMLAVIAFLFVFDFKVFKPDKKCMLAFVVIGDDPFGDYIVEVLDEAGIDTSNIARDKEGETALAFVSLASDGNRDFKFYRKNSADLRYSVEDIPADILNDCGMIHFCSVDLVESPMKEAHKKLIDMAIEQNVKVSFDPNLRFSLWDDLDQLKETVNDFLKYADIIKISDEELEFITGHTDIKDALDGLFADRAKYVIYTKGADGAEVYTRNGMVEASGYKIDVRDTTGAGDSFIGAFLYCLLNDEVEDLESVSDDTLRNYLDFANAYAANTTTKEGALAAMADRAEMDEWMKTLKK